MKITGTREAFYQMLQVPAVHNILGISKQTVSNMRRTMEGREGRNPPTLDKMEEMLTRYGAKVVKEKVWEVP